MTTPTKRELREAWNKELSYLETRNEVLRDAQHAYQNQLARARHAENTYHAAPPDGTEDE